MEDKAMNRRTGSGDKFLDIAAYILAILLFAKTADVMGYFSPEWLNGIFGLDVSFFYGITCAFLVEGMALALHFNSRARLSGTAQGVKWVLVAISAVCQVLDGYLATGNAAQMSDTLKLTLQVGVPLIPIGVFIMLIMIGHLPDDGGSKAPFIGLKNVPGKFKWIWEGGNSANSNPSMETIAQEVEQAELGKKPAKNFTKGGRK
jgi:hypothetical protein